MNEIYHETHKDIKNRPITPGDNAKLVAFVVLFGLLIGVIIGYLPNAPATNHSILRPAVQALKDQQRIKKAMEEKAKTNPGICQDPRFCNATPPKLDVDRYVKRMKEQGEKLGEKLGEALHR